MLNIGAFFIEEKVVKIINIKINKLNPSEYNPRLDLQPGDKEYEDIKRSVVEFGLVEPLVVNGARGRDGIIIGGHQRYKVLKELNFTTIPCIIVNLDKTKEKMLNIALNKISGDWDRPKLKDLLLELDSGEWDITLTGWGEQEIEDLMTEFHIEPEEDDFDVDKAVEAVGEPICKRGDIWQLGEHRLMCGDSTIKEDVEKLMDGEKADLVFTDPPYNVDYDGGVIHGSKINRNHKRDKLLNDDIDIYSKFISILPLIIDNGAIYIFYATRNSYEVFKPLKENNIRIMSVIAWIKVNTGYADMNSHYKNRYEPIVYCGIGEKTNFIGSTSENTTWEIEKDRNNDLHPTQKPITVPFRAIKNHDAKIVADLFLGSGSTLIACEQLNRICYGMEIDPIYCDVIIKRFEQYTNKKAVMLNE